MVSSTGYLYIMHLRFWYTSDQYCCLSYPKSGHAWDDEYSKHWKSDRNICEWGGITCNEKTGEVIGLAFPINGMKD